MQITLVQMAIKPLQELQLLQGLHAFGNHDQVEATSHGDDGADDFGVVGVAGGVAHE
ncbi:hypothetical protein D3C81_2165000 [compost metagenome]